jgi:hypothetical protein
VAAAASRRPGALVGVLCLHAVGALTWVTALGVGADIAIPFVWWLPSYLLMIALVYGWS